ncbi:hypothetical protein D9M70_324360 [compost metagenome]
MTTGHRHGFPGAIQPQKPNEYAAKPPQEKADNLSFGSKDGTYETHKSYLSQLFCIALWVYSGQSRHALSVTDTGRDLPEPTNKSGLDAARAA